MQCAKRNRMRIANPIYDSVFKYLLTNDLRVAKLVISNLINKNIVDLKLSPTEFTIDKNSDKPLQGKNSMTVMHLDFTATIVEEDGTQKVIIIEMQKAKLLEDIMRFRKYLGLQYKNPEHKYEVNGKLVAKPILPIFILGHTIDDLDVEALMVKRSPVNAITNEKVDTSSKFIEGITHDCLIIQIPAISNRIEAEGVSAKPINKHLKELLSIFDQTKNYEQNNHFLHVDDEKLPKWLQPVVRALEKASTEQKLREQMDIEDDYIAQLEGIERDLAYKDKLIEENTKALAEKDQALEEKDHVIEENAKILAKKDNALELATKALMKSMNISREDAIKLMNLQE